MSGSPYTRCSPKLLAALLVVCAAVLAAAAAAGGGHDSTGRIRTYYIAADVVAWNYAPSGRNLITGRPFGPGENVFVRRERNRIGHVYLKALYREYADAGFSRLKPRGPRWRHLGLLGPVIHAEVGDTVRVVFKNNLPFPSSIHAHGVLYAKSAEGAPYADGTSGKAKADDAVPPGRTHVYVWKVPERAGPGPMDGSSVLWMYHSHVDEVADTNSGLVGPIVVTRRGTARADGSREASTASSSRISP